MQPFEVAADLAAIRAELAKAQNTLQDALKHAVRSDHAYRLAKARAYLRAEGPNQAVRDSEVEISTEEERMTAKLDEGQVEAAKSRLQNLRAELSAVTSLVYLSRTEMDLAR